MKKSSNTFMFSRNRKKYALIQQSNKKIAEQNVVKLYFYDQNSW